MNNTIFVIEAEFENALNKFLRDIGLSLAHQALVKAFVTVSEGEIMFEASATDLARLLYGEVETRAKADSQKARYAINTLFKWQEEHQISLIKETRPGTRPKDSDGQFLFIKPEFEFVMLSEIVKGRKNGDDFELIFQHLLAKLRDKFKPRSSKEPYHPRHLIKRAKNTIITKMRRVFEYAVLGDLSPEEECNRVLKLSKEVVEELQDARIKELKTKKFIAEFEQEYSS